MTRGIRKALISVDSKEGLLDLAGAIVEDGYGIIATGGTGRFLEEGGISVDGIEDSRLGGRIKTLKFEIHAALLARRDDPNDLADLDASGITPIDLAVVNFYDFDSALDRGIDPTEFMDIGGVAIARAAAKNHRHVSILSSPEDYPEFIERMRAGRIDESYRKALATRTFERVARYDAAIASAFKDFSSLPECGALGLEKVMDLRYGENPHQSAAWYAVSGAGEGLRGIKPLLGPPLSYNNLLDIASAAGLAVDIVEGLDGASVVFVKHRNPCGAARAHSLSEAVRLARAADEKSAYGGVLAVSTVMDEEAAAALDGLFLECVIAPGYEEEALALLSRRKKARVISWPEIGRFRGETEAVSVPGGLLIQTGDGYLPTHEWRAVTKRSCDPETRTSLEFAWKVAAHSRSNAIVIADGSVTAGIGAGTVSRVDAARIAVMKMEEGDDGGGRERSGPRTAASDAFLPFPDTLEILTRAGVEALVQPGGSIRDNDVIAAANEKGLAMFFTGRRHFRH